MAWGMLRSRWRMMGLFARCDLGPLLPVFSSLCFSVALVARVLGICPGAGC